MYIKLLFADYSFIFHNEIPFKTCCQVKDSVTPYATGFWSLSLAHPTTCRWETLALHPYPKRELCIDQCTEPLAILPTHMCVVRHISSYMIQLGDDTTVLHQTTSNDESDRGRKLQGEWWQCNSFSLKVSKWGGWAASWPWTPRRFCSSPLL